MSDGLVYRCHPEVLPGREGAFNMDSFLAGRGIDPADPALLEEARLLFGRMIGDGDHLGLFSEGTGEHGEALGDLPPVSPISSAFNLERALGWGSLGLRRGRAV